MEYINCCIVYVPLYVDGFPLLRSLVWYAASFGIVLFASALLLKS